MIQLRHSKCTASSKRNESTTSNRRGNLNHAVMNFFFSTKGQNRKGPDVVIMEDSQPKPKT